MKSGLEDRNNTWQQLYHFQQDECLNEVRPGRPEQYDTTQRLAAKIIFVSMKSGLEDRNNSRGGCHTSP